MVETPDALGFGTVFDVVYTTQGYHLKKQS